MTSFTTTGVWCVYLRQVSFFYIILSKKKYLIWLSFVLIVFTHDSFSHQSPLESRWADVEMKGGWLTPSSWLLFFRILESSGLWWKPVRISPQLMPGGSPRKINCTQMLWTYYLTSHFTAFIFLRWLVTTIGVEYKSSFFLRLFQREYLTLYVATFYGCAVAVSDSR